MLTPLVRAPSRLVASSGRSLLVCSCPTLTARRLSAASCHQRPPPPPPSSTRYFSSAKSSPNQQRGADLVRRRQLLNRVKEYQLTKGKNGKKIDFDMSINKPNVREVLKGKYPAKAHAKKVKEWIVANGGDAEGVIYLEGQKTRMNEVSFLLSAPPANGSPRESEGKSELPRYAILLACLYRILRPCLTSSKGQ